MIFPGLKKSEKQRVKRAAEFAGLPWRPICTRPATARAFVRRVEAEMHCFGAAYAKTELRSAPFAVFATPVHAWLALGRLLQERR